MGGTVTNEKDGDAVEGEEGKKGGWRRVARAFLELVYPSRCIGCDGSVGDGADVWCVRCRDQLNSIGGARCPKCGFPFGPHVQGKAACPACRGRRMSFSGAIAVFRYEGPLREAVLRWKYGGDLRAGRALREALLAGLANESMLANVDAVVPVPLHWQRRVRRRFDQSADLAAAVSKQFGLPLRARALRRVRRTRSQVGLTIAQREDNVRGAFRVLLPQGVQGLRVLLLDDVLTTGATCNECARALRRAGAKQICVAALARAAE